MHRSLLAAALLLVPGCASNAALPIPNASFETGEGKAPAEWTWWSRTEQGTAQRTQAARQAGQYAMRIHHDGPRDWAFSNTARFDVQPGQTYRATAWTKVAKGNVELAVVALAKGKTLSWSIGSARAVAGDKWTPLKAVADVPPRCDQIYVRFVGNGDTSAWIDDVSIRPWTYRPVRKPKVRGHARRRVRERLDRALIARPIADGKVYLGWRLLDTDPADIAFNVYRRTASAPPAKLNSEPVRTTTDFVDASPPKGAAQTYFVRPIIRRKERDPSREAIATPTNDAAPYISFPLQGDYTFQKVGIADLDGDGRYDYVIKQPRDNIDPWHKYWKPSPDTYKLEAYRHDGTFLWSYDLGWAIERGIWYSPYVVHDLDGDGRAEVAVKTGEGDPRDPDGKVQSGPEHVTILDGLTGKPIARAPWPDRAPFMARARGYNYASRNQMAVAYLDGKTPCLLVERGTYNLIKLVAYELRKGRLRELWQWDNTNAHRRYWGQGAHWMHAADLDDDGRDEVVIGSAVIDDNGVGLWSTGLGHPDHCYVTDIDPSRPGLEMYYGMETRQKERNGMCLVDAKTGTILWGHEGFTRHVHSCGMCSDIDARHPGAECYSADTDAKKKPAWARLRTAKGQVINENMAWKFGPRVVHWDADPQREILWRRQITNYGQAEPIGRIEGSMVAVADILGDWREEIITSVRGELRIYTTTIPATDRRSCLMTDHLYRMDVVVAAMGYYQVPMTSYDLASRAK